MKHLYLYVLLLLGGVAFAQNPVEVFVENPLLRHANVSLLVKDLETGNVLHALRSDKFIVPASTMKVVTTATALEMYGPDFRFETKLAIDGRITKEGVLQGNLYIYGGGDPTLGSEKIGDADFLNNWVDAVKKAGIKSIHGKVIADPGLFEHQVINPKWTWEDMGNYFASSIHGISYLDNTLRVYLRSDSVGSTPQILRVEPDVANLNIENYVVSSNIGFDSAYFYGTPFSEYRFITGEIPANREEFCVKGDIPNPALLLAQRFHMRLMGDGIAIVDYPVVQISNERNEKVIYTHYSPRLKDIINETNIHSNNHYAEHIFKYIGTRNAKVGTNNAAIKNIREFWKSKGLPVDELNQCDGSGLSPSNGITANFFVQLLTYMKDSSQYAKEFYKSLPVSGKSGTMKSMLDGTKLEGKVHAKSGSIDRVRCYVGYIDTQKKLLVFAVMVNNAAGKSRELSDEIENFLLEISK